MTTRDREIVAQITSLLKDDNEDAAPSWTTVGHLLRIIKQQEEEIKRLKTKSRD